MVDFPKYDIVYILKEDVEPEELRYSIRSVAENFPYNRIIFYCGCPNDIKPDVMIPFKQEGYGKINKVIMTLKAIMTNDDITEDFWLFNDDFYILKPMESTTPWCEGSLDHIVKEIQERMHGGESRYTMILKNTAKNLIYRGMDTLSYATHTPMLINRKKGLKVLKEFTPPFSFRSAYGNYWKIGGEFHEDVKITSLYEVPTDDYILLSTDNTSFKKGEVGKWIRERFPNPCKYEFKAFEEKTYFNTRE